jgi:hypothetical protein
MLNTPLQLRLPHPLRVSVWSLIGLLVWTWPAVSQTYTQRGFIENRFTLYPQKTPNDAGRFVAEALLRYEGSLKLSTAFQVNGALDVRTDTHRQTERKLHMSWWDRERRRPLAAARRLSAAYHRGGLSIEAGKQFVRWGKADILNPTDRFAPRDYLTVVDNEFLGITAARLTYEKASDTFDVVWSPRLTPSRIPLPDQRWAPVQAEPSGFIVRDGGAAFPFGSQAGLRWNHIGVVEFSASYYEGFNHLPSFAADASFDGVVPVVTLRRLYPRLRMVGADAAVPLRFFEIKAEAAYFNSADPLTDDYAQYVVELERHSGEWTFVGGYAGEHVFSQGTRAVEFAPDRGITKTVLGSARYTIDVNRSIAFETSIRQNLDGAWVRAEYSQAFGQHWRATGNVSLIRGKPADFLGQYRRNSRAGLILRYSF